MKEEGVVTAVIHPSEVANTINGRIFMGIHVLLSRLCLMDNVIRGGDRRQGGLSRSCWEVIFDLVKRRLVCGWHENRWRKKASFERMLDG